MFTWDRGASSQPAHECTCKHTGRWWRWRWRWWVGLHCISCCFQPPLHRLCSKTSLPQRDIIPRWQGEQGADVRLFVAAGVKQERKKDGDGMVGRRREILLILAGEGQASGRVHGRRGDFRRGLDSGWESRESWLKWSLSQELDGQLISSGPEGELGLWQRHFILHRTHTRTHTLLTGSPVASSHLALFPSVPVAYLPSSSLSSFLLSSPFSFSPVLPLIFIHPLISFSPCPPLIKTWRLGPWAPWLESDERSLSWPDS